MDKLFLTYEEFGAVGDGVTDDLPAIVACHEEANKKLLPVKARDGAKYYIGGKNISAVIKTDVDFGKAEFIIDDVTLENIKSNVFLVKSDYEKYDLDINKLMSKEEKIALHHEGSAFVRIYDENHKCYIRKGLNENGGSSKSDIFIVDEHGNIATDLDWTYSEVTKCEARRCDDRKITITGGIFTTIANQQESFYNYHNRAFRIERDNVTIENVTHYVTGELDHGAPYDGFFSISLCTDVTVRNCLLTPHFIYRTPSKVPGKDVSMGTYDISVYATIRTSFINITQTIDIMNSKYWGLMGSNFCKEMLLLNCNISRFDAHMGVTNATIKGCRLGHQCLNLIGHGKFLLEDTYLLGKSLINLRSDYGSTWHGDIEIKNCTWQPLLPDATLFNADNTGDHDFGYTCYMPENIDIDGLTVLDGNFELKDEKLYLLPEYDKNFHEDKPFAYVTTKSISVSSVKIESGREFITSKNPALYSNLTVKCQ